MASPVTISTPSDGPLGSIKAQRAMFPVPPADSRKHHVRAKLNYYDDPGDGTPPTPVYPTRVQQSDRPEDLVEVEVTITDISGEESNFTLDKNGFQLYYHESKEKDFLDDETIKLEYYSEIQQLLKQITGASRVVVFDHTIRRNTAALNGPVQKIHVDQTYSDAELLVKFYMKDEADALLKKRHEIINVWRPIKQIFKDPLAVADRATVPEEDLVSQKTVFDNYVNHCYILNPNPRHRFYYRYGQTPDIVTLIKCFDSKLDGRMRNCPHSAFISPETDHYPTRESIEVRTLLFYDDDTAQ